MIAAIFATGFYLMWSGSTADHGALLAVWLFAHASVVALFGLAANVPDSEMWKHVLAGMAFGGTFVLYEGLFLLYRYDAAGAGPARFISPVLVLCLLLALVVTVHGFLRFHFRVGYVAVGLALVVVAAGLNSLVKYKNELPGLEAASLKDAPRTLDDADGPGLISAYNDAVKNLERLQEHAENPPARIKAQQAAAENEVRDKAERLRHFYRRFLERYESHLAAFTESGGRLRRAPMSPTIGRWPTQSGPCATACWSLKPIDWAIGRGSSSPWARRRGPASRGWR